MRFKGGGKRVLMSGFFVGWFENNRVKQNSQKDDG